MKKVYLTLLLLCNSVLLLPSCIDKQEDIRDIYGQHPSQLINAEYFKKEPIAQIINLPVNSESSVPFEMEKSGEVVVYGVGELLYNFADSKREYFFKGDDIELFFNRYNAPDQLLKYDYSWSDAKSRKGKINFQKYGSEFTGYLVIDSIHSEYIAQIKFPWKTLITNKILTNHQIDFDIQIGDNDDGFVQKSKIGWTTHSDLMLKKQAKLGHITVLKNRFTKKNTAGIISAVHFTPVADSTGFISSWSTIPGYELKNVVMGMVKDKYDLSSKFKVCWDNDALYFLVQVQDSDRKIINEKKIRNIPTFLDHGWIEDDKGNKIWDMHVLDSKSAGGAIKNQAVLTHLRLKKGKYQLKYISDESHAYNNWDDTPPTTGFYGIIIYSPNL